MSRIRTLLAVVLAVVALVASGCVSVPTSGPVEKVEGQPPECQNCINVDVAPPSPGDDPKQVVQGFLRATSNFQPNYAVARQFLTTGAAEKWAPESGVSIYSGSLQAAGNTVILDGRLVGSLGPDRTYTAQDKAWRVNFGMVKENGEWRISTPPPGLMVAEFAFSSFYQSYNLYFVGNGSARRTEKAPGHLDERAAAFDADVGRCLRDGLWESVRKIDRDLARELWASVDAIVEMASLTPRLTLAHADYDDDPYGVQYWVLRWWDEPRGCQS